MHNLDRGNCYVLRLIEDGGANRESGGGGTGGNERRMKYSIEFQFVFKPARNYRLRVEFVHHISDGISLLCNIYFL